MPSHPFRIGRWGLSLAALLLLALPAGRLAADTRGCDCRLDDPASMAKRECSLCREAEKQPAEPEFFVLKDANPLKPNRWLVLPRAHGPGSHPLHKMDPAARTRLWKRAIEEAQARFPYGAWGVAYNAETVRTQCHLHVHVGRFIPAAENSHFRLVRRVEDFPAPSEGGILIHPVGRLYHVHTGEDIMETALVR